MNLSRWTPEQRLRVAQLVRGEGVLTPQHRLAEACREVGVNCDEIAARIGPCVEYALRAFPTKRLYSGESYQDVPTDLKDGIDFCLEECHPKGVISNAQAAIIEQEVRRGRSIFEAMGAAFREGVLPNMTLPESVCMEYLIKAGEGAREAYERCHQVYCGGGGNRFPWWLVLVLAAGATLVLSRR